MSGNIFVNQAGYVPGLVKYVYATQQTDSFFVIEISSGKVFYSGSFVFLTSNDPNTGLTVYKGDFSAFSRPGIYLIRSGNGEVSFNFTISDSVFKDVTYKSLKGLNLSMSKIMRANLSLVIVACSIILSICFIK